MVKMHCMKFSKKKEKNNEFSVVSHKNKTKHRSSYIFSILGNLTITLP